MILRMHDTGKNVEVWPAIFPERTDVAADPFITGVSERNGPTFFDDVGVQSYTEGVQEGE